MRTLPEADLGDRLREIEAWLIEKKGAAFVRRLKTNIAFGVPGFIVLNALFSPVRLTCLWIQVPVAVAYSWLTAQYRFTGFKSGAALLATQFVLLFLTGKARFVGVGGATEPGLVDWFGILLFFAFGLVLGVAEEGRIQDDG